MAENPAQATADVWGPSGLTPILDQWVAKHGPLQGKGYAIDPLIDNPGVLGGKMRNPMPAYRYVFADGSTLEGTWDGAIKAQNEVDINEKVKTGSAYDGSLWERTQAGWKPVLPGDPNYGAVQAADLAEKQRKLQEITANAAAGRGNLTDDQWNQLQLDKQKFGLDQATLNQRIAEFGQKNANDKRQLDISQQAENRLGTTAAAQNALTAAQTVGTGVETKMNEERLRQLILAGPEAQRAAVLGNDVTQAQLDAVKQKMLRPEIQTTPTGPYITAMQPGGEITQQMSLGYQPKTMAEIEARKGQMHAAANAKKAEIEAKFKDNPEEGLRQFNAWYETNIQSQLEGLRAATDEAAFLRGKDEATMRQQAMQQALGAGNQAVTAYQATGLVKAGEGAADFLKKAAEQGNLKGLDWASAAFANGNELGDQAAQKTAEALKYIDPRSAQATGQAQPNYAAQDVNAMFNRVNYTPFGQQAAPAPAPGAVPAPTAGPTPEQLANRRMASFQTEAATAAAGTPFGTPIGNNPMLAAQQRQAAPAPVLETGFGGPLAADPMATAQRAASAAPAPRRPPVAPVAPAPNNTTYMPSVDESLARLGSGFSPQPPGFGYDPTQFNYNPPPYTPPAPVPGYGGPVGVNPPPGFGFDPSHMYEAGQYSYMVP